MRCKRCGEVEEITFMHRIEDLRLCRRCWNLRESIQPEQHTFSPGQASYGQTAEECFYCWGSQVEHIETPRPG